MTTQSEKKAILKQIGNPAEIDEQLRAFRTSARVLSSDRPRMIEEYPDQWIAVYRGKVVATGESLESIMNHVSSQNIPAEDVIARFIEKNLRTMIL